MQYTAKNQIKKKNKGYTNDLLRETRLEKAVDMVHKAKSTLLLWKMGNI